MGEFSKIEWTDHTFNPWIGCTKVSDGCKHCYAETLMDHRYNKVKWGPQGTRQRTGVDNWKKPLQWNERAKAKGIRYRVFCASLADVFEDNPQVEDWRNQLFAMIDRTANLDWLLLTKRPENIVRMVSQHVFAQGLPHNVWLGTSVENQEQADRRIPELLYIPATVRFLSMEPLLGPVDLKLFASRHWQENVQRFQCIDWVIVGGESGQNCRPMQIEWAQNIRQQCRKADVAFFMKQIGGNPDKRHDIDTFPPDLQVRQFPTPSPAHAGSHSSPGQCY